MPAHLPADKAAASASGQLTVTPTAAPQPASPERDHDAKSAHSTPEAEEDDMVQDEDEAQEEGAGEEAAAAEPQEAEGKPKAKRAKGEPKAKKAKGEPKTKKAKGDAKADGDSKPKKELTPYMIYNKIIGAQWKALTPEQKAAYQPAA
jgi:hypothetical protein